MVVAKESNRLVIHSEYIISLSSNLFLVAPSLINEITSSFLTIYLKVHGVLGEYNHSQRVYKEAIEYIVIKSLANVLQMHS